MEVSKRQQEYREKVDKWKGISDKQREWMWKLFIADDVKRNHWYEITAQNDIEFLLERFGGFHDAYIETIKLKNAILEHKNGYVLMTFSNCWVEPLIQLKFSGLHRLNLIGKKCEPFYECHLSHDGKIIFADNYSFDPSKIDEESKDTIFVISDKLCWRFIDKI